jgi:hypothetical protein
MQFYKVICVFNDVNKKTRTVKKDLTLEEAQAICKDPETSSRTCVSKSACKRTEKFGHWFYSYTTQN